MRLLKFGPGEGDSFNDEKPDPQHRPRSKSVSVALALTQSATAVAVNITSSFLGVGGVAPYSYAVLDGGAAGTIDPSTGVYTAPSTLSPNPKQLYDTVQVTDADANFATSTILVGTPLLLFCEILEKGLGLAPGRTYLWDQKINQPTDYDLYIAVSVPSCKPFGNVNRQSANGASQEQFVAMQATADIDIISRGPAARDRKEEVILALNSIYAQQQQEANSFYIGKLPPSGRFVNLSQIDGAAIPYRYRISVNLQYAVAKTTAAPYFDNINAPELATNP